MVHSATIVTSPGLSSNQAENLPGAWTVRWMICLQAHVSFYLSNLESIIVQTRGSLIRIFSRGWVETVPERFKPDAGNTAGRSMEPLMSKIQPNSVVVPTDGSALLGPHGDER